MKFSALAFAVAFAIVASRIPDDPEVAAGLALFVLVAFLWLTEAVPLTFTALLVPVVAIALGLSGPAAALEAFADPIIFLFLGGFTLSAALSRHGLDRWMARRVLLLSRGRPLPAALLLALATALLSMWISNTATAAMMLPVALGLVAPLADSFPRYRIFLLLALAWAANLGGIATLVGSPPNAIVAAALDWDFGDWFAVGLPVFAVLFPVALAVLFVTVRPEPDLPCVPLSEALPFPRTGGAAVTLAVFGVTVLLWTAGAPLARRLGIATDFDTWVALLAMALLGVSGTLRWRDVEAHTNWGVLLLFGGGIALSGLMQTSGTSAWLAERLAATMPEGQIWLMYLLISLFVVFLTELVSNTASAALLVPLLMPVAEAMGGSPLVAAVLVGISASCAFMLPVATPPNALVYGTGHLTQASMVRAGLRLNLVCAALLGAGVPLLTGLGS